MYFHDIKLLGLKKEKRSKSIKFAGNKKGDTGYRTKYLRLWIRRYEDNRNTFTDGRTDGRTQTLKVSAHKKR